MVDIPLKFGLGLPDEDKPYYKSNYDEYNRLTRDFQSSPVLKKHIDQFLNETRALDQANLKPESLEYHIDVLAKAINRHENKKINIMEGVVNLREQFLTINNALNK